MNEHELTRAEQAVRNPEVTYDPTDLSARGVFTFLIFLAVGGVVIVAALWGMYKYIARDRIMPAPAANPMIVSRGELKELGGDPALRFPAPRLQPDPVADFNKFREVEEMTLNSYGWVDQANGKVHIPIEAAIDAVAKTGLPTRPEPAKGQ